MLEEANTVRNLVGQLNALIAKILSCRLNELNYLKDEEERSRVGSINSGDEWLKDCWLRNGIVSFALVNWLWCLSSNMRWYGSILNILQGRNELLEKIIGCVVDSGGVLELDPKDMNQRCIFTDSGGVEDENNSSNGL
ncbi:hypothetical protein Tco_0846459 [Tanacetum coccineum]